MRRLHEIGGQVLSSRYQVHDILNYERLLDRLNFDHIKMGDHTLTTDPESYCHNPSALLASIGALTKRIRLIPSVTDPYRRHPVEIAHWVATLDQITTGRTALGIGAGEMMNLAPFGIEWDKPFRRLREAIEVIKLLWEATPSNPVDYEGEIFRIESAYLQTRPVQQPRPPIYVGAVGPKTRELAGEIGDGWLPMAMESPRTLKEHLADVERGARKAGKSLREIDIGLTVYTDISEDQEKAYATVDATTRGAFIWERSVLRERLGIEVPQDLSVQRLNPTDKSVSKRIAEIAPLIPRRMVEEATAFGTVEDCIKKFEQFLSVGATSITAFFLASNPRKAIESCATKIIPYLKEQYGS
jgi:alkanesulfonate monooxygenase SsuD/methylene tetrahydromethanopterin reductase-like flavin-dependent oxidoreductase (luciferase family)